MSKLYTGSSSPAPSCVMSMAAARLQPCSGSNGDGPVRRRWTSRAAAARSSSRRRRGAAAPARSSDAADAAPRRRAARPPTRVETPKPEPPKPEPPPAPPAETASAGRDRAEPVTTLQTTPADSEAELEQEIRDKLAARQSRPQPRRLPALERRRASCSTTRRSGSSSRPRTRCKQKNLVFARTWPTTPRPSPLSWRVGNAYTTRFGARKSATHLRHVIP